MSAATGEIVSVNVGRPRQVEWHGRTVTTAIWKNPVPGRVLVEGVNLAGDDQADRRVHGGETKAVYAYAAEDYAWWAEQLGEALRPGTFGENLTLAGVDLRALVVGERWRAGTAVLRVTEPRFPCFKLGIRMGDAAFVDRFGAARRSGSYFAIERAGMVGAGDAMERLETPDERYTIGDFVDDHEDGGPEALERLAGQPLVSQAWREHAERAAARARAKAP
ncbi:MAG TPA: MOSC domain-containing protein [Acidimicrobiales bacterium]